MPHDKNGNKLEVGDKVTVEFEITGISPSETMCNLNLKTTIPMDEGDYCPTMSNINSKQTEKVVSGKGFSNYTASITGYMDPNLSDVKPITSGE